MATLSKEQIEIKIGIDTTELDEALEKTERLVELLEKTQALSSEVGKGTEASLS